MRTEYTRGQKPGKDWTTRQLRKYIRETTRTINLEYKEYEEQTYHPTYAENFLNTALGWLQSLAGTKPKKVKVGLGLTYKHKDELLQQAQALWNYQIQEIYTPGGKRREKKREIARYMEYTGYEPPKDIETIDIEMFDWWQDRYETQYNYEDYVYNNEQKEWDESYEDREERMRQEIGHDAYDMADEADKKKFDSFIKNHDDIDVTFDEWREMVMYAAGAGSYLMQSLNSETIVEQMRVRNRTGRSSLSEVFNEAFSQLKAEAEMGRGEVTSQKIVDRMNTISKNWGQLVK